MASSQPAKKLSAASAALKKKDRPWGRSFFCGLALAGLSGCGQGPLPNVLRELRCGLGASAMALSPEGDALAVACLRSNDVWILDLKGARGARRFDTAPGPGALAYHPSGEFLYLVEPALGSLAQLSLRDLRVLRRWRGATGPGMLQVDVAGQRLLLGLPFSEELALLRMKDLRLEKTLPLGGRGVAADPAEGEDWLILAQQADSLQRFGRSDLSLIASVLTGPEPRALALDRKGGMAAVACSGREGAQVDEGPAFAERAGGGITLVRLRDDRRVDYWPVPGHPVGLAYSPSRRHLIVLCASGELRWLNSRHGRTEHVMKLVGKPSQLLASPRKPQLYVSMADTKKVLEISMGGLR